MPIALQKSTEPKPRHTLEEIVTMSDHLAGAVASGRYINYARERAGQAVNLRDQHIREARQDGARQIDIAKATGLSVAMVRVICRGGQA